MNKLTRKARAKINLTLDVTAKRDDGYHLVEMVMQTVDLADDVTVEIGTGNGIELTNSVAFLPNNQGNIAYRAAELFLKVCNIENTGIRIHIEKNIPVAAGLAGGSTNAAAVLMALNELYQTKLSQQQLMQMGLQLGADVPYCICGGTMLAEGIGEVLTRLPQCPECYVVLCKPPFDVSTADIYRKIDSAEHAQHPDTKGMIAALKDCDYQGVTNRLYNVMEPVTGEMHTEIYDIKNILLDNGADGAIMSGSGPTTFGLFQNEQDAKNAYDVLKKKYADTHFSKISNSICE